VERTCGFPLASGFNPQSIAKPYRLFPIVDTPESSETILNTVPVGTPKANGPDGCDHVRLSPLIAVFKDNRFSTTATLRHVVRETGYHHAGQARNERKLNTNQN
jgi:hypothetical protein